LPCGPACSSRLADRHREARPWNADWSREPSWPDIPLRPTDCAFRTPRPPRHYQRRLVIDLRRQFPPGLRALQLRRTPCTPPFRQCPSHRICRGRGHLIVQSVTPSARAILRDVGLAPRSALRSSIWPVAITALHQSTNRPNQRSSSTVPPPHSRGPGRETDTSAGKYRSTSAGLALQVLQQRRSGFPELPALEVGLADGQCDHRLPCRA